MLIFFMLNSAEHEISTARKKPKIPTDKDVSCFNSLRCCINVKMPTIVGILTFLIRINFELS